MIYEVRYLVLESGKCPFEKWMDGLRDLKAQAIIRVRIDRIALGNFGNCRDLKGGLWELKINFGPGYRVYFGKAGEKIVLLLTGGDKSSQKKDVNTARDHWQAFKGRKK